MKVYWAVFDTSLRSSVLAARRRRLLALLRKHSIELVTVRTGQDTDSAVGYLAAEAHAAPVIALDDKYPLPDKAPWLATLTGKTHDLLPARRPQVIYITARATAAGTAQALRHSLIRKYLKRDEKSRWVDQAAEAVIELVQQQNAVEFVTEVHPSVAGLPVIGQSECFRSAVHQLGELLERPYCLVTGEPGVGKLYLIRAMWKPRLADSKFIVLPCGSFFKDYYVGGMLRRFGGGREAIEVFSRYLYETENGILVLYQVHRLPTAIQEEITARITTGAANALQGTPLIGVDLQGLQESNSTIIATTDMSLDDLRRSGRLIPELMNKLFRHQVRIPTLFERGDKDIRLLSEQYLQTMTNNLSSGNDPREGKKSSAQLSSEVAAKLCQKRWPGNISELIRVLEYASRHCKGGVIRLRDLPPDNLWTDRKQTLDEVVRQAQITAIQNALDQTGGSVSKAALLLGKNRGNLHRLMSKLGMQGQRGRERIV